MARFSLLANALSSRDTDKPELETRTQFGVFRRFKFINLSPQKWRVSE